MDHEIVKFIAGYISLSKEEMECIEALELIRKYRKGSILLKPGEVSDSCFLVLKGCVKSYFEQDGEEKITGFFLESQPIFTVSYMNRTPSEYYLSCLEDSIICVGSPEKTKEMISKIPKLEAIGKTINGEMMVKNQIQLDTYMTLSPEKRYLKLLETNPDLCNRVPQYQLASYLGIKPESLSRIRKRLLTNKV